MPVRERAGEGEVRGPVAPDVDVARPQATWLDLICLVQKVHRPRAADEEDRGKRPWMTRGCDPRRPSRGRIVDVGAKPFAVVAQHCDATGDGDRDADENRTQIDVAEHHRQPEPGQGNGHRPQHGAESQPLFEAERDSAQVRDAEAGDHAAHEKNRRGSEEQNKHREDDET